MSGTVISSHGKMFPLSVLGLFMDVVSSYLKDSTIIIQGKEKRGGSWDMGQMWKWKVTCQTPLRNEWELLTEMMLSQLRETVAAHHHDAVWKPRKVDGVPSNYCSPWTWSQDVNWVHVANIHRERLHYGRSLRQSYTYKTPVWNLDF